MNWRATVSGVTRNDRDRPEWVGNRPEIAKYVAQCQGCGIQGRTVDPIAPGTPYAHFLKVHYEPLYDGRCAQCAVVLADA